jgi:arylsulfatase A-like enzyme
MRSSARRGLIPGALVAVLALGACRGGVEGWNVLILVADDVGVDLVGAYGVGSDRPPTPNIDALARGGVLFRNAWSNPACSTTRATIQTGRYAFRTGVGSVIEPSTDFALGEDEVTLPEMLDRHAPVPYAHAAFGKWHLAGYKLGAVDAANRAGYAHFEGTLFNHRPPVSRGYFSFEKITNGRTEWVDAYATTDTVDSALRWIASAPQPWLAYVAFHAAHTPFHAPPEALHGFDLPPELNRRLYFKAMVEALDTEIGRLLRDLDPETRDRTVVMFLSDNGTEARLTVNPKRQDRAKGTIYEGGINVPFIVSGPVVEQPGRESTALVNTTDVFATLAELAGVEPVELAGPLDSVSLVPYLRDPAASSRRATLYAEWFEPNGFSPTHWTRATREERYKLIRHAFLIRPDPVQSGEKEQLYDLELDPFEQRNLLSAGPLTGDAAAAYDELSAALSALRSPDP